MKRIFLLGLLVLAFSVVGCGTDKVDSVASSTEDVSESVTYTLNVNEEAVTENVVSVSNGTVVVSLIEEISDDVVNRVIEGDFLSTEINETILDIDYPAEEVGKDGTTIVSYEYHMKEVPVGQVIHVTITKELQERLGLDSDIIEITCE